MIVIGVDPGDKKSALVMLQKREGKNWTIGIKDIMPNTLLKKMVQAALQLSPGNEKYVVIEKIVNYNQKVGASIFDTVEWVGRFKECFELEPDCTEVVSMPRRAAVGHLCEFGKSGSDKYVKQALIKRFGDPGTKAKPGVLYDFSSHTWAALAIAVTYIDKFLEVK